MRSTSPRGKGSRDVAAKITPQSLKGSFTIHSLLQISTVEWKDLQFTRIDRLQATDVDGDRFAAVRCFARLNETHPAGTAEQVVNDFLVELVVAELVGTRFQFELT